MSNCPSMKGIIFFAIFLTVVLFFYSRKTSADTLKTEKMGIGIILGEPSGASLKYWKNPERALDAGLTFSFDDYMLFYSDYLFHFKSIKEISPYAGIGGVILFSTYSRGESRRYTRDNNRDTELGLRVPLGIEWLPATYPLGVFGEIVPGIGIIPDTFAFFQAGIGARYYF